MPETTSSQRKIWYLLLAAASLTAGSLYTVTKLVSVRITPLSLSFFRYFFALIPMVPFFIIDMKRKKPGLRFRQYGAFFLLGALGISGFALLFFYGVVLSTAVNGPVIVNTQPIFAVFLAPLLARERITVKNAAASAVGIIGVALIVTGGNLKALSFGSDVLFGNLLLLGSALVLTVYTLVMKKYILTYGSVIPTCITMFFGTLVLTPVVLFTQGYIFDFSNFRPADLLPLFYIGAFCTAFLYLVFNKGLGVLGAVATIGFKLLIPVSGIALSIIFLGERPELRTYAFIAVVLGSILALQWSPGKKKQVSHDSSDP